MFARLIYLLILLTATACLLIDNERQYRELQSIQARQVFQKQILLEEQSKLRLALNSDPVPVDNPAE